MLKILSLVCLMFTSLSVYSFDFPMNEFSTKKIVRAKLWYEGVRVDSNSLKSNEDMSFKLPEELSVAIDLLDS